MNVKVLLLFESAAVLPLALYMFFNFSSVGLQTVVLFVVAGLFAGLLSKVVSGDLLEARKTEQSKIDFVSMAAHELRTPLTVIKGYLVLFRKENKEKFSADQSLFLDRIELGAKQLTFMIENFLNVSRIERGVLTINTQILNWVEFVGQVIGELKGVADVKHIRLGFEAPLDSSVRVTIDPIRIQEVIINLVNNAINYTPDGGRVRVFIERKDNEVITHVSDTGEGISPEQMRSLFTKFYRVSGAGDLTAASKGSGLGLFISKTIVEMHKGRIWVDSREGEGTTFSFALPVTG